jgi:endonuclease/exonuclease/phosphatase family metal-dependent hydrolase
MLRVAALSLLLLCTAVWADGPDRGGKAIPYLDPKGPFYSHNVDASPVPEQTLHFVTFNIHFSGDVPGVIEAFRTDPIMKSADVIYLQEVTGTPGGPDNAARTIAEALGMSYVYSPAVIHPENHLDFGNAILSRWRLRDFRRVILPHAHPGSGNRRVAVAATIRLGDRDLRLYSLHLETIFGDSELPSEPDRADQVRTVLDAIRQDGIETTLVAGDFNSWDPVGMIEPRKLFKREGFFYGNPGLYRTLLSMPFKLDHVFGRGIERIASGRRAALRVSDHVPVWMDFQLE